MEVESEQVIQLTVLRSQGTRGRVVVTWRATTTRDVSAVSLQPSNGSVGYHIVLCISNVTLCREHFLVYLD